MVAVRFDPRLGAATSWLSDPDFAPVRNRAEFRRLLDELPGRRQ
jgi:hypothetical protein